LFHNPWVPHPRPLARLCRRRAQPVPRVCDGGGAPV